MLKNIHTYKFKAETIAKNYCRRTDKSRAATSYKNKVALNFQLRIPQSFHIVNQKRTCKSLHR